MTATVAVHFYSLNEELTRLHESSSVGAQYSITIEAMLRCVQWESSSLLIIGKHHTFNFHCLISEPGGVYSRKSDCLFYLKTWRFKENFR